MTKIEVLGPRRDWAPEWTDPDTGEVFPGHWVSVMLAEAVGIDGMVYSHIATCGIETDAFPAVRNVRELTMRAALERDMRNKGVWAE